MKTTTDKNRTSRFAAMTCAAMILGTVSIAQPNPGTYNNSLIDAQKKLKAATEKMEQSIRYEAPAFNDRSTYAAYKARLDAWVASTENSLRYEAPSIEAVEVAEALSDLKASAEKIRQSLCYEAPSVQSEEAEEARERLNVLAAHASDRIRYNAPTLDQVEAAEARQSLAVFAEKTVHEMLKYVPEHPAVFAFEYASPVSNHENNGEYLTQVP